MANLSDRGNGLPCNSELPSSALTLFDGNASWQKSGPSTEEAPLGKLLLGSQAEEAPQAKLLPPIRGKCARVQYKTLYKVTLFVERRKWLPLGFPLRRSCTCICLVVETRPQFKTNGPVKAGSRVTRCQQTRRHTLTDSSRTRQHRSMKWVSFHGT